MRYIPYVIPVRRQREKFRARKRRSSRVSVVTNPERRAEVMARYEECKACKHS